MIEQEEDTAADNDLEIAVIGMAGRFPGAKNIDEFWENLKNGVESVTFFTPGELAAVGIKPDQLESPNYVKTNGALLENKDYFDASFFGFTAREAETLNPQVRIFHECAWEALENAGYALNHNDKSIGLYAGASDDFEWKALCALSGKNEMMGAFALSLLADKDHLCTRVSYNLNLNGPSAAVKTACSTSLAAIHMACQALLNGECDLALAGGISIGSTQISGYLYQEGMVISPDGHCRAFDKRSKGFFSGEGVGIVVLKVLEDAAEDRDHIYAVIKGTAINNDGYRKVGFSAPSVIGQAEAIRMAYKLADIEPESISYIETHGTGTNVGDPIEIEGLKMAFNTEKKKFCALGSVKTNIGHLDAGAGVAAIIKTVLALKHRLIPPTLHYENPNPKIDFENSPFWVNTRLTEWKNDKCPLRAGVSSFGIGGTNAHVILEEAPISQSAQPRAQSAERDYQLILLSAKTESALDKLTINLVQYLKKNPRISLADAAYTLQSGRQPFPYRKMAVCSDIDETISSLSSPDSRKVHQSLVKEEKPPLIFVFAGLGSQYVNMGRELYEKERVFQQEMDHCFEILRPLMGYDIKEILYPTHPAPSGHPSQEGSRGGSPCPPEDCGGIPGQGDHSGSPLQSHKINQTEIAQLAIFIVEYALTRLLMEWGVTPHAMIGYSFGEYTAACLAGVFSLRDALRIIVMRGQLIRELPAGGMLSVPLPRDQLQPFLNEGYTELSIAIDNGPSCVVSGPAAIIADFEKQMKENRYICVGLHASHALHSPMMEPVLKRFQENMSGFALNKNQIPYISNVTGKWISGEQAADPAYWSTHFRETVRFADGIKELLTEPHSIFVEIGPGHDLSVLLRHHRDVNNHSNHQVINLMKHSQSDVPDCRYLLNKIGGLWLQGVNIDWTAFSSGEKRYRVPLPHYPFEGQRYWIDGNPLGIGEEMLAKRSMTNKKADISRWMYVPSWKRSAPPLPKGKKKEIPGKSCWLVFMDECGLGAHLLKQLENNDQEVIVVRVGKTFDKVSEQEYALNPGHPGDYNALLKEIRKQNKITGKVVHLWHVTKENGNSPDKKKQGNNFSGIDTILDLGFYSLLFFARATGKEGFRKPLQIMVISNHLQEVTGEKELCPAKAAALGAVKVIPKEYPNISCRCIDIILPDPGSSRMPALVKRLLEEFSLESPGEVIAYRGDHRWEQTFDPVRLEGPAEPLPRLKIGGVYLVSGGLGGIGFVLAKHLTQKVNAKLILTGRSPFPGREEWDQYLNTQPDKQDIALKINKVRELEDIGSEVLVCSADAANPEEMRQVIALAKKQFGTINGVIHAAGVPDGCMIPLRTKEETDKIMSPKVKGTLVLEEVLEEFKLDFFVICSSLAAVLGPFGQIAYCAANAFQDSFAQRNNINGTFTVSINWDTWQKVGMGVELVKQLVEHEKVTDAQFLLEHGILPAEGIAVFDRILDQAYPQVVVSTRDLEFSIAQARAQATASPQEEIPRETTSKTLYPRPQLSTEYVPPATDFEKIFTDILQKFLGFEEVGIHDNIFEFGITSLAVIHINGMLKKKINKDIPVVTMFEFPTVHSLQHYLEQEEQEESKDDTDRLQMKEELMQNTMSILSGED